MQEQNEIKNQFNLKNRIKELEENLKKYSTIEVELKQAKDENANKQHMNDIERNRLTHDIDSLKIMNSDLDRKLRDVSSHSLLSRLKPIVKLFFTCFFSSVH